MTTPTDRTEKETCMNDLPCPDHPTDPPADVKAETQRAQETRLPFCPPHLDLVLKHPDEYAVGCIQCERNELAEKLSAAEVEEHEAEMDWYAGTWCCEEHEREMAVHKEGCPQYPNGGGPCNCDAEPQAEREKAHAALIELITRMKTDDCECGCCDHYADLLAAVDRAAEEEKNG